MIIVIDILVIILVVSLVSLRIANARAERIEDLRSEFEAKRMARAQFLQDLRDVNQNNWREFEAKYPKR